MLNEENSGAGCTLLDKPDLSRLSWQQVTYIVMFYGNNEFNENEFQSTFQ